MTDNDLNSHEEIQRQQLIGNAPTVVEGQPNAPAPAPAPEKSKLELILEQDSQMVKIVPSVFIVASVTDSDNDSFLDTVIKKGDDYYTLHSPIKTGRGTEDKPYGVLTQSLKSVVDYLKSMSVTFPVFGQEDLSEKVEKINRGLQIQIEQMLFSIWKDNHGEYTVDVEIPQQKSDGFSLNDSPSYMRIDLSDIFRCSVTSTLSEDHGLLVINLNLNIGFSSAKLRVDEGFSRSLVNHKKVLTKLFEGMDTKFAISLSSGDFFKKSDVLLDGASNFENPILVTEKSMTLETESLWALTSDDLIIMESGD